MCLNLIITKKTDEQLKKRMVRHYSKPKGFVGRSICYAIYYDNIYYGHIIGGSATLHLPNRNKFFGINKEELGHIVNNIFFNISKVNNYYPLRNFTTYIVKEFMHKIMKDWEAKYNDSVIGFETLIELPRTGELYRRAGFVEVGITKGFTCKRIAGKGTDSWTGKRVWETSKDKLRPKLVLCCAVQKGKSL